MALRIVDQQMMLQRPADMAANRAQEIRQMGTTVHMGTEVSKETALDNSRVQQLSETENQSIRPDADGHNKQEYEGRKGRKENPQENEPPADKKALLMKQASARLVNLPVERGKYARREEHSIDIQV